jgi:hypothetical protein
MNAEWRNYVMCAGIRQLRLDGRTEARSYLELAHLGPLPPEGEGIIFGDGLLRVISGACASSGNSLLG